MKSHNMIEILDELRSSVDLSKTIPLLAATAVIQAKNIEELISLVQSNTFTEKTILKQFVKITDKEKLDVPVAISELNVLLSSISRPVLQNYIFKCVDYFKLGTAKTFFDEAIQIVANAGSKLGALATTSSGINTLAIKILDVQPNDSYLDPTCGYGGAIQLLLNQNPHQVIVGQELNALVADIAKMRSFVSGATKTQIFTGDVLGNPLYIDKMGLMKFDRLYSDAPIGVKYENLELLEHDPYNRFMWVTT